MSMYNPNPPLVIEDARIFWRNFAGKEGEFNAEGARNFHVEIPDHLVDQMVKDGWNVKFPKEREGDDTARQPHLEVAVSYKVRPPRIIMITSRGRNVLDEDLVDLLDHVEIDVVDVSLNPSRWSVNGKGGIKAYLKVMYLKVREDPLVIKWGAEEEPQSDAFNE